MQILGNFWEQRFSSQSRVMQLQLLTLYRLQIRCLKVNGW